MTRSGHRSRSGSGCPAKAVARLRSDTPRIPRHSDGKPNIPGIPANLAPPRMMALTREDRGMLGLWDGDFVRDAQGLKRIVALSADRARAEDDLVAAGDLSIDGKVYRLTPRFDLPAGQTFQFTLED